MAITQTAISYYGLNYVEHAEKDFQEMLAHGCTTVILAVTEFDFDFWFPNIPKIVNKAQKLGLRVLLVGTLRSAGCRHSSGGHGDV